MAGSVKVEDLAAHPDALPELRRWFEAEWPSYYGPEGPGDARSDLQSYANRGSLPVGVVAYQSGVLCGVAALKADSIASHRYFSPWAAAGLVKPSERGKGIGRQLLGALEERARGLGFSSIYSGTSTAHSLLERNGWQLIERVIQEGRELGIYRKAL